MKKQIYLFLPILMLLVSTQVKAQLPTEVIFPGGPITPLNSYEAMDGLYGDVDRDSEGLVQAVFCYDSEIGLDAVELGTGEVFASYRWFLLDKDGEESTSAIHTGNGADGQMFTYQHLRTGYHRFRVYGYNAEEQGGCFEITDIAVYVFPQIAISEEFIPEVDEFCENEEASLAVYTTEDGVTLNAADLAIDVTEEFNGDEFTLNYEWYIIKDGERESLGSGDSPTYKIGAAENDLNFSLGAIEPGVYEYGVRAYYMFEGDEICETADIKMYDLTVTEAPAKPVIRINGAVNSRQQQN